MDRPSTLLPLLLVTAIWGGWLYCPTVANYPAHGRELYFPSYYFFAERRLMNHTIETLLVKSLDDCEYLCYLEDACVSLNIKNPYPNKTHECELNNSTHMEHHGALVNNRLYYYRGAKNNCGKSTRSCENNSTCQSGFTDKGYRCVCTPAYQGEHCEEDIDECAALVDPCNPVANSFCTNTNGSYFCLCKDGFVKNGTNCEDVDECALKMDNCSVHAVCTNTKGSFSCDCKKGFNGNGNNCTDIDECAAPVNPCNADANSACNNTNGSYICQCKDGFIKSGSVCEDIDECAAPVDPCNAVANSVCNNTKGSYHCPCKDGFVKNGRVCEADVCQNYQTLSDAERKETYVTVSAQCDDTLNGWYRFQGAAGTKMAVTCPSVNRCGGHFPGWLSDGHPTVAEGKVTRKVCFFKLSDCCADVANIQVKNCGSYYIYYLSKPPGCNYRYCGTD